jgi:hypothetical protein
MNRKIQLDIYQCKVCNYETNKLHNWTRHISSKKHCKNIKDNKKCFLHECKRCNYKTTKINHWEKHLQTLKHKQSEMHKTNVYLCNNCNKTYKYASGLKKHLIGCTNHKQIMHENTNKFSSENKLFEKMDSLITQNTELQKKLLQIAKEPKIEKQTNNFNIIQYLQTDCKDAMNWSDFINTLKVTYQNLDLIEKQGYLRGVQDSLVIPLQQLEPTRRPIHCTDQKRNQFYIKDNDNWDKDQNQQNIEKAIRELNTLQLKALYSWQQMNPDWLNEDRMRNKVNQITQELTSMYCTNTDIFKKKIMNEISNVTVLKKDDSK